MINYIYALDVQTLCDSRSVYSNPYLQDCCRLVLSSWSSLPRRSCMIRHVANHQLHAGAWIHGWQNSIQNSTNVYYISNAFIIFLDNMDSLFSRAFLNSLPKAAASGGGTAFPTCLCLF